LAWLLATLFCRKKQKSGSSEDRWLRDFAATLLFQCSLAMPIRKDRVS
jgi:hypothetical protein